VAYLARGPGYTLFVKPDETVLSLGARAGSAAPSKTLPPSPPAPGRASLLRFRLAHPSKDVRIGGEDPLPGRVNYFIGNDPAKWQKGIPTYARVKLENVRPGVDLVYYGTDGQLEFDFVLRPGAKPEDLILNVEGARTLMLSAEGDLRVGTQDGEVVLKRPDVYQETPGGRKPVDGRFVLMGRRSVGFRVGPYDMKGTLVVDPVLSYSTYLGGTAMDMGYSLAVDGEGQAYVCGFTQSVNFPTSVPFQAANAGAADAFVCKLSPAGNALVYATYLGGSDSDAAYGLALGPSGEVYLTGTTNSVDLPTLHPVQAAYAGFTDAFVAALNAEGSGLLFSTYLGGTSIEQVCGIARDASGDATVLGTTLSTDFPTVNPMQAASNGSFELFVCKYASAGSTLRYSTYLGGSGMEGASGLAADGEGNAYLVGTTFSTDFPTAFPLQAANAGNGDTFVTKVNPLGSALVFSTYLGGTAKDEGYGLSVAGGSAYVVGATLSADFPTVNPFRAYQAAEDGYVARLNPQGSALLFSTFLGGSGRDWIYSVAVDDTGATVLGITESSDLPTVQPLQAARVGQADLFISSLNAEGSGLLFSTYLGGSQDDQAFAVKLDPYRSAYLVGSTNSPDFPVTGAYQGAWAGDYDAVVAKVSPSLACTAAANPVNGTAPLGVDFAATAVGGTPPYQFAWQFGDGGTATGQNAYHTYTAGGTFNVILTATDDRSLTATDGHLQIAVAPPTALTVTLVANPTTGSTPLTVNFRATAAGGIPQYTYAWIFGDGGTGTGEVVSHTYATAGSFEASVTVTDSVGTTAAKAVNVHTINPPVITGVAKGSNPFRLIVTGSNFHQNCTVKISGTTAPETQYVSSSRVKARGGSALKALCPKGVTVQVTVTNNDDGGVSAPFPFTR
jgi:PKD repeat protein